MTTRPPTVLFAAKSERWAQYETPLRTALVDAGLGHATADDRGRSRSEVDYIVYAPNSGLRISRPSRGSRRS
jgi:glyoxylate/hydroxypyruvate reductase A